MAGAPSIREAVPYGRLPWSLVEGHIFRLLNHKEIQSIYTRLMVVHRHRFKQPIGWSSALPLRRVVFRSIDLIVGTSAFVQILELQDNSLVGLEAVRGKLYWTWKRPLSSMAPMLSVKKNEMETSRLLVSGGPKISTSVVQVFINMHCWVGMPLFEAVAHPSIHDQLLYRGSDVPVLKAAL